MTQRDAEARGFAEALADLIASGSTPELDPVELVAFPGSTEEERHAALKGLVAAGRLARAQKVVCPEEGCGKPLTEDDVEARRCPHCRADYRETGDTPAARTVYRVVGGTSRDVVWMAVAHGMNTRGPWQEELSWRLSSKLRYSAPVLIYKFGLVRVGVLFSFRHRALVRGLGRRLQRAVSFSREFGRDAPPDVILHSFGTLLFARLLDNPEFADLRFGRVILAGAILRPDHDWGRHIASGRVEAILNHCGGKDDVVGWAALAIPGSGPCGRLGLRDPAVLSVLAPDFNHSTFFQPRGLTQTLADNGLWDRFLRLPLGAFEAERMDPAVAARWRPLPAVVRRGALPLALLAMVAAVVLAGFGLTALF